MRRATRAGLQVFVCVGLLACGDVPDPRLVVTGRLVGELARPTEPALDVARRRVGSATRPAVSIAPGGAFELPLAPGDREVVFSLALRAPAGCRSPVAFSVADGRAPLHREQLAPGGSWQDRRLALDPSSGATRIRFAARLVQPARCPGEVEALFGAVLLRGVAELGGARPAPSVILISMDTLGAAHLGAFENDPAVSPHLDRFLSESFSFRRAYAQYGYTLPSHASLFTGLYPRRHGLYRPEDGRLVDSLVRQLARHGYLTAAFTEGGFVAARWGFDRGFDWYDDGVGAPGEISADDSPPADAADAGAGEERPLEVLERDVRIRREIGAEVTFDRAAQWIRRLGSGARFFLFVHTYEVHAPYIPRDAGARAIAARLTPGVDRFFREALQIRTLGLHNSGQELLSEAELQHLHALHSAEIHYADRIVGRFLAALAEQGLAEDVLVVLTADHGEQFGEHGRVSHGESLHNRVLHVPLGMRWPRGFGPGASDAPVMIVDVLPTILDLAGVEAPPDLDGRTLAPVIRGESAPSRPAFSEQRYGIQECERRGLALGCRLDRAAVQGERFKLMASGVPAELSLYDLSKDPLETRDVSVEHPDELRRHRELLEHYRRADAAGVTSPAAPLADAERERLRALGYLP